MKNYEAPHAQIVSFENDYVATGTGDTASPAGLLYIIGNACTYSTGDPVWDSGCGASSSPAM